MYIARFCDNGEQKVRNHLQNVAYLCGIFAKENRLYSIATLCGFLHDMGKYSQAFQEYIRQARKHTENNTYEEWKKTVKTIDHGAYGAKYIYQLYGGSIGVKKSVCDIVAEAVAYHHGGLPDNLAEDNTVPLLTRMEKIPDDELENVVKVFYEENPDFNIKELFEHSEVEIKNVIAKTSNIYFDIGLVIKNIYSYLVDADRLDSYLFETSKVFAENKDNTNLWELYLQKLENKLHFFTNKTSENLAVNMINHMRKNISEQCFEFSNMKTGIYTLTVPTGGGKTLSSLRFALNHSIINHKQRIFYIIPYTTIIEQNARVVRDTLECNENLLEYHSNITNDTESPDFKLISERFDSPIVFTTMVQFLNCFYADGNDNIRRMHNFENSVIIFDEIQTLPLKCTALFFNVIAYLKNVCNTTSILCTATQPNFDYIKKKLQITFDGEMIQNLDKLYGELKRMEVIDHTKKSMDFLELAEFVCKVKEENTSVLVVLNKVNSAETLFEIIKDKCLKDTKLIILTSRLCPKHRANVIKALRDSLDAGESVICISTQLIEAGVDISFSTVVRSLCGLDSIAQASGRGNRNGEKAMGKTYIVEINEENVSMLKEIAIGQKHTKDLLLLYENNEESYDDSLLSPKAISKYYAGFYEDEAINKNLYYPLENNVENNIVDLLTQQKKRINRYKGKYPLSFIYQFKTARKRFAVINNKTYGVIAPYDEEAKELMGAILSKASLGEKYSALKELQKYSVNIYENLFYELSKENAFIQSELDGIYLLSDMYYDENRGVTTKKTMGLQMF